MKKNIYSVLLVLAMALLGQVDNPGYIKSVTDPVNGRTYSNIKSDSLNTLFYKVIYDRDLLYEKPNKNAEVIDGMTKFCMVELLKKNDDEQFYKVRMQNESGSLIEGWSRRKSLSKEKYYGRSLTQKADSLIQQNMLITAANEYNPQWIMNDDVSVYADSALTTTLFKLQTGSQIFVHDLSGDIAKISIKNDLYQYQTGFVKSKFLSPFAIIKGDGSIETLLKDYELGVLEHDLVKSGFVNYLILETADNFRDEYVEDKLCRERDGDTVSYKQGFSNNKKSINKYYTVTGKKTGHNFAFYRYLPDEKVRMGLDSIVCKVIEIVYKPKTALITINGIEDGSIENQVSRLMLFHLDKFKTDILFHRQDDFYRWTYKWQTKDRKYLDKHFKHTTRNKRLVRMNLEK